MSPSFNTTSDEILSGQDLVEHQDGLQPTDLGMVGEIIQNILLFLNSPAFAAIVEIIRLIVDLIIGAFSLVSLLGYHGFQDKVVSQYVTATSFFVAISQTDTGLFNNGIQALILGLHLLANRDLFTFALDWKTILWEIILWIIERLTNGSGSGTGSSVQSRKIGARASNSFLFSVVKGLSVVVCLYYILG